MKKKIIYIDMDNVLVDFPSAFKHLESKVKIKYANNMDDIEGIFSLMQPMPLAIESFEILNKYFDVYILSTAPWDNPSAWSDKLLWVKKHLPKLAYKKLILSHNKNLNLGDYLIDDRLKNGASSFTGEHIHFGSKDLENWNRVMNYLSKKENFIYDKI